MEDPYHVTTTSELTVSFVASKRVRLTAQMMSVIEAASEDCSQFILQQAESEQLIKFIVRLPKLGIYKLQASVSTMLDIRVKYKLRAGVSTILDIHVKYKLQASVSTIPS